MLISNRGFANPNGQITTGFGSSQVLDETSMRSVSFEYRENITLFKITDNFFNSSPMAGLMVLGEASRYVYTGINFKNKIMDRMLFNPNFAFGGYFQDSQLNLGGVIQFRSGIELGYQMNKEVIISMAFHHISNASIYKYNPGTETLTFLLSYNLFK